MFLGGLKGITGLVTKPLSGIVDGASKTAEGIKNNTKIFDSEEKKSNVKKKYINRPFYGTSRYLKPYNP